LGPLPGDGMGKRTVWDFWENRKSPRPCEELRLFLPAGSSEGVSSGGPVRRYVLNAYRPIKFLPEGEI
jgi:hypothetical protein